MTNTAHAAGELVDSRGRKYLTANERILSEQWPLEPGRRMLRRVRADDEEDPLSW